MKKVLLFLVLTIGLTACSSSETSLLDVGFTELPATNVVSGNFYNYQTYIDEPGVFISMSLRTEKEAGTLMYVDLDTYNSDSSEESQALRYTRYKRGRVSCTNDIGGSYNTYSSEGECSETLSTIEDFITSNELSNQYNALKSNFEASTDSQLVEQILHED